MLIGRKKEVAILNDSLNSGKSEMIVVYGRRRVGKTFLIKQVLNEKIDFDMTGVKGGSLKDQLEIFTEKLSEKGFGTLVDEKPKSWLKAFSLLKRYLKEKKGDERKVIFLDELSWIATPKSKFLGMLGHFWNDWALYNNVFLILCGSAASWMIDKVINDKGGLHNRATQYLPIQPFTLNETEQFFKARKIKANHYEMVQTYMAFGGIPFYLDLLKPQESIPQNIDRLCFDDSGFLKNEFGRVFQSLFDKPESHIAVVKALGTKWKGLTRQEVAKVTKLPNGGGLTRTLNELEKSAFIKTYYPFGKKKKGKLYRLTDNFALFHLRFISNKKLSNQRGIFLKLFKQADFKTWTGYAFENICMTHLPQIAKALRIEYILHEFSSFRFKGNESMKGIQIDLLVEREDRVINLFEIKFSNSEYRLTPEYKKKLEERSEIFAQITKTKKSIFTALITTYGLENKADQSDVVQHVLTFDDLFAE